MSTSKDSPQFDVMIPFYGDVDHLKEAISSVMAQTYPKWKLTVVDDGYPDRSIQGWINQLADSRITYIRNETNLGANANYRKCVSLVSADLVVMMGADDCMRADYMESVVNARTGFPLASMFQPAVEIIDESSKLYLPLADRIKKFLSPKIHHLVKMQGEEFAASLMRGNWTYFPAICWSSDAIKNANFRSDLDVTQDLALLVDLAKGGHEFIFIPDVQFQYRRHTNSDSSVRALDGRRFKEEQLIFKKFAEEFEQLDWSRAKKAANLHIMSRLNTLLFAGIALRRFNFRTAARLLRIALT